MEGQASSGSPAECPDHSELVMGLADVVSTPPERLAARQPASGDTPAALQHPLQRGAGFQGGGSPAFVPGDAVDRQHRSSEQRVLTFEPAPAPPDYHLLPLLSRLYIGYTSLHYRFPEHSAMPLVQHVLAIYGRLLPQLSACPHADFCCRLALAELGQRPMRAEAKYILSLLREVLVSRGAEGDALALGLMESFTKFHPEADQKIHAILRAPPVDLLPTFYATRLVKNAIDIVSFHLSP